MLTFPSIDPVAFHLGLFQIHWYGLMYGIGFLAAWGLACLRTRSPDSTWGKQEVSDLIFYAAIGVILGGRIGYILIYNLPQFLTEPLSIFKIWEGGMSFHGGLIGVAISIAIFARRFDKPYFVVTDFVVPLVPIGLGAGRIGNFINAELWGRVTTVPWGMVFPNAGPLPRHPSQLYEFFLEGLLLFILLWIYSSKPRPRMAVTGMFMCLYGVMRFICECFREPDPQLGFIFVDWLTMGQLLSFPMIVIGFVLLWFASKQRLQEAS